MLEDLVVTDGKDESQAVIEELVSLAESEERKKAEELKREEAKRAAAKEELQEMLFEGMMGRLGPVGEALRPFMTDVTLWNRNSLRVTVKLPQALPFHLGYFGSERVTASGYSTDGVTLEMYSREELAALGRLIRTQRAAYVRSQKEEAARREHEQKMAAYRAQFQKWERVYGRVKARNAQKLQELQASVDVPFRLWQLDYGIATEAGATVAVEGAMVLESFTGLGWRTEVRRDGALRRRWFEYPVSLTERAEFLPSEGVFARRIVVDGPYRDLFVAPDTPDEEAAEIEALAEALLWPLPEKPDPEPFGLTRDDVWEYIYER